MSCDHPGRAKGRGWKKTSGFLCLACCLCDLADLDDIISNPHKYTCGKWTLIEHIKAVQKCFAVTAKICFFLSLRFSFLSPFFLFRTLSDSSWSYSRITSLTQVERVVVCLEFLCRWRGEIWNMTELKLSPSSVHLEGWESLNEYLGV